MTHESKVLKEYFSNTSEIYYYGDPKQAKRFVKWLETAKCYECNHPDFYFLLDNEVLIAEHFEFDSRKRNRKGSQYRKEEARIDRRLERLMMKGEKASFTDTIQGDSSYEYFIKNVSQSFEKHYSEIEQYEQTLKELNVANDSSRLKIMFIIEDVSPLGSAVGASAWDKSVECVTLAKSKEFLGLLDCHEKVDYVLALSSWSDHQYIWLIDRKQLGVYYSEAVDYASMDFVSLRPQVAGGAIPIR